jgi:hypothetical protein
MLIAGKDGATARFAAITPDPIDGLNRLQIAGKIAVSNLPVPAGGTKRVIVADTPLSISGSVDKSYLISSDKAFFVQQIVAGAEGDSNERGCRIEVIYKAGGVEHIMERIYVVGFTQFGIYPDTNLTRDETLMVGDGTATLIIRRTRLSGASLEVDAVVRGYEL